MIPVQAVLRALETMSDADRERIRSALAQDRRLLPHNLEAEGSILGGIMLRNSALVEIDNIQAEDFYDPKNRVVFEAMVALAASSTAIDPITLEEELRRTGKLAAVGGLGFLSELLGGVSTADNIRHHADIVRDKALALRLIQTASGIAAKGFGDYGTVEEYFDEAARAILALTQRLMGADGGPISMRDLVREAFRVMDQQMRDGERIPEGVVPTGFTSLDFALGGGLPEGVVTVLGGRPSKGKSSIARSIADNMTAAGGDAIVYSLEDSRLPYAQRALADRGRVDLHRLRTLEINRAEFDRLQGAANELYGRRRWILDDTAGLSSTQIMMRTRSTFLRLDADRVHQVNEDAEPAPDANWPPEAHRRRRRLVVVDYLQLVSEPRCKDRRAEVERAIKGLDLLARQERIPVLVLSQLTRANEHENRPPTLSDLRESGEIEQVANVVLFVHQQAATRESQAWQGVIVEKNKHGPPHKRVRLDWDAPSATYRNPARTDSRQPGDD